MRRLMTAAMVAITVCGFAMGVEDGMGTNHVKNLQVHKDAYVNGSLTVQGVNGTTVIPNVQFVGYTKFGTNQASVFTNGNGSVYIAGNTEIAGTLWVQQLNIGGGTLSITNLEVLGVLSVNGSATNGSTVTALANFNIASNVVVGKDVNVGNNLTVANALSAGTLTTTGNANIGGTLSAGNTTLGMLGAGNTTIGGTLSAGNTTVGNLGATGNANIGGTLGAGNTTITGTLGASGNTTLGGTLVAVGKVTFNTDLSVGGTVYVGSNIVVTNNATVTGSLALGVYSQTLALPGSQVAATGKSVVKVAGTGGVTLTSNPQITGGVDGQVLILQGTSDTDTVTFSNGNGLVLEFGVPFKMGAGSTLQLIYDATSSTWREISRQHYGNGSL